METNSGMDFGKIFDSNSFKKSPLGFFYKTEFCLPAFYVVKVLSVSLPFLLENAICLPTVFVVKQLSVSLLFSWKILL